MTDRSFGLLRTLGSNAHEVFYCKLSTPSLCVVGDHGKPSCNDVYGTSAVVGDVEKPFCTVVGDVDKPSCLRHYESPKGNVVGVVDKPSCSDSCALSSAFAVTSRCGSSRQTLTSITKYYDYAREKAVP